MDTPDRNPIAATPSSKFEDSPVFSYINNLSPIKPVKSIQITQTFNSLSFSSPPSVFTSPSPHVSSQRESRFLKRNFFSGLPKFDLSSIDGLKQNTSKTILGAVQMPDCPVDLSESFDGGCSIRDDTDDPKYENLQLAIELPHTLKYDCGSPEFSTDSFQGIKKDTMLVVPDMPVTLVHSGEDVSIERQNSFQSGVDSHGICRVEQIKEDVTGRERENLISDTSDLPLSDSSKNTEASKREDHYTMDLESRSLNSLALPHDSTKDGLIIQPFDQKVSCENHGVDDSAEELMVRQPNEKNCEPDVHSIDFENKNQASFSSEIVDDKAGSHFLVDGKQRGIRRRCLVFEASGARKRELEDDTISSSLPSSQLNGKLTSYDKQLVPIRSCTSFSPCMLPGIGLHLNAIAATTKDPTVVKHEILASGKTLISMPSSLSSLHSLSSEEKPLSNSLGLSSLTAYISPAGNDIQGELDASQASAFQVAEDFNENSPKKKRRRLELGGESGTCKRCNCKKSKCLKLYCECFAAGVYCVEPCSCQECFNKPVHEDIVLATRKQIESRNPLAFAPRVIRSSDSVSDIREESNKTPASARHKRGCNCKKSNCLKKYCECYQGGVGCSINCRCEGCKNTFGMKDGFASIGFGEAESAKEEVVAGERNSLDNSSQTPEVRKDEEKCPELVPPLKFSFQICRTSIQLPFSSISKPPKSTMPRQKFEKHSQIMSEDETTDIQREGNMSPICGIKTASPNSKRVSPPHRESAFSLGKRNKRKLVLQSMPPFPSLTQNGTSDLP